MEETVGFFDVIWSGFWLIFWLFLLVAWFWVLISVLADVFRSKDIGGFAKALWIAFVIIIPWLGVLCYIIIRGGKMQENSARQMQAMEDAQRSYIRNIAGTSPAAELEKLVELKEKGVITDAEFAAQKAKILAE
ncbi:SHOCT domain-containing protein [Pseudoruegeria sp. HB172150]|uniref:SHOCT domain-containing protein n=1 Tax=Pseudoruegeria sp. HB172150 TaxID=2721164 RepID=UPI0015579166|nr:SHOCT domain-containing protein [Pseudoruegeria sp. HB172150]